MADAKRINNGHRKVVIAVVVVCAVVLSCAAALCFNLSFANARGGDVESFGLGTSTSSTKTSVGALAGFSSSDSESQKSSTTSGSAEKNMLQSADNSLTKTSVCDMSQNVNIVRERKEAERLAAEEAERKVEEAAIQRALEAQARSAQTSLSAVDFTVGRAAFVAEWGARIDAYLEGSPLAGYGNVFAEAAFDNGVDPRWSPAIANTESGKGTACFRAYNAWGWMGTLGDCWEDSIRAHVAGLANGYGYTISLAAAQSYCPPTYTDWYEKTLSQMALI